MVVSSFNRCFSNSVSRELVLQDISVRWMGMPRRNDANLGHYYRVLLSSKIEVSQRWSAGDKAAARRNSILSDRQIYQRLFSYLSWWIYWIFFLDEFEHFIEHRNSDLVLNFAVKCKKNIIHCKNICIRFSRCWSGYNLSSYFWILEGPRFAVILVSNKV